MPNTRRKHLEWRHAVLIIAVMAGSQPAWADPMSMQLADLGHGSYALEGHLQLAATPYDAWKVLTDYENIATFVTSLRKSAVTESSTDRVLLEQEALGKKLFLSKKVHVLLEVTEIPYKQIDFEDISKKDFHSYKGSWEIKSTPPGVEIVYRLSCQRGFTVPNFIAKDALKKSAESLLSEVGAEILRRKGGGKQPCTES